MSARRTRRIFVLTVILGTLTAPFASSGGEKPLHRRALEIRKRALGEGQTVWLDNDRPDSIVSFCRTAGADQVVSLVNLSNRSVKAQVDLPPASYLPLVADKARLTPAGGRIAISLEGFGYFVGKKTTPEHSR